MYKETISDRQGIYLVILFIVGTNVIMATALDAKQDFWLAIILAIVLALPVVFIYSRLHVMFPGKNLFDIIEICFGKVIGKVFIILLTFYLFETGCEVLRNFAEFVNIASFPETPLIVPAIVSIAVCAYAVKEGIELMGRWSKVFFLVIIFSAIASFILLMADMDTNNLKPLLSSGIQAIVKGTSLAFLFPFTQILPFTMAFADFQSKKSPYKVYLRGLVIGGIFIILISLTSVLVLGVREAQSVYHPAYIASKRINIGKHLQRLEILNASIFSLGAFIKVSVYLLAASNGVAKIFNISDYRFIVVPSALLILNLSYIVVDNIMEFWEWTKESWKYYAFLFQVFLPVIVWITAEIKHKQMKKT